MEDKKRRGRTGCLTCRARRVKCDEEVPQCRRCVTANVACAGYGQRRVVVPVGSQDRARRRRQMASPLSPSRSLHRQETQQLFASNLDHDDSAGTLSSDLTLGSLNATHLPTTTVIGNRTPLVAFPSGPRPSQCPSLGARHVLGYHQVLLRTIPLLFHPHHLQFWRDELLQEAWGCNYLYLTLVALGNSHRAALMTVADSERDRANGLDTKITAVQFYTEALRGLAEHLDKAKQTPVLLVANLCLMAYFESFNGNIPGFIGRFQAAGYYFTTLLCVSRNSDDRLRTRNFEPLRDCLRSLCQTCYITLPLQSIHASTEQDLSAFYLDTGDHEHSAPTASGALCSLTNLLVEDVEMKEVVWSPIAAYTRTTSVEKLIAFEQKLVSWKNFYLNILPELDTDSALNTLLVYKWSQFAIPPPSYTSTTRHKSLAAAHYNFYRARVKWALILLGHDLLRNKLIAEFYFYEALRHATSHMAVRSATDHDEDTYIPCEALKTGLLPVLHMIGLCSPDPLWLEFVRDVSDQITQEGVIKGHTFATNLGCLHKFEMLRLGSEIPTTLERYPEPAERIICQLVPETDGRHFTSFFAAPAAGGNPQESGLDAYRVIGQARWRCNYEEGPCTPIFSMYDSANLESFSMDWLYNTQPALDWLSWSQEKEFDMKRALEDHISGTRLLLATNTIIADP